MTRDLAESLYCVIHQLEGGLGHSEEEQQLPQQELSLDPGWGCVLLLLLLLSATAATQLPGKSSRSFLAGVGPRVGQGFRF